MLGGAMKDGTLSGSELRQYLHISTRKLKYLMDHDYIPHENTGQVTYKYRVRIEDARTFKRRMDTEPDFLAELSGLFASGSSPRHPEKKRTIINSGDFHNYLLLQWEALPDALPTQQAARLIGVNPQRLHEKIKSGALHGVTIRGRQYCVKLEIIAYASTPQRLAHPCGEAYKALIKDYLRQKAREQG